MTNIIFKPATPWFVDTCVLNIFAPSTSAYLYIHIDNGGLSAEYI
jgi:hypothetical protein